jgi:hypothetical protein
MGGKNTKQASATEWDNHATLDQSSRIPYNTQVFQKYNTNIKALIDNLNPELSELSFTELLNNTLPYNTKYENVVDAQAPEPAKSAHVIQNEAHIDNFADSPFLSPIKYANLLNSITSENIQQGGAKNPKPKTGKKTDKTGKKANKKPPREIPDCNGRNKCKRGNSDTSTTENHVKSDDSNKTTSEDSNGDNSDDEGKNSDSEADKSDKEADKSEKEPEDSDEEAENSDESEEPVVSGDSDEQHGKSNFNTKYQSDSSNNSVRTSEINMIGNDSY